MSSRTLWKMFCSFVSKIRLKPWQKDTEMKRIWILRKGTKSDVGVHLLWGKASCHWCTWDNRRWRCGSLQTSPWPAPPTTTWWQRCRCTSSSSAGAGRRCRPSSGRRWPGLRAPALHEADTGPGGTTKLMLELLSVAPRNVSHKWFWENDADLHHGFVRVH